MQLPNLTELLKPVACFFPTHVASESTITEGVVTGHHFVLDEPLTISAGKPAEPGALERLTVTETVEGGEDASDRFHAHLDQCTQCEQHPFNLCPVGQKLLEETA